MEKTQKPTPQPSSLERQAPNADIGELMRQQGSKPFQGFESIDALWTPEFKFDGFYEWYRQYKTDQKAMARKRQL